MSLDWLDGSETISFDIDVMGKAPVGGEGAGRPLPSLQATPEKEKS